MPNQIEYEESENHCHETYETITIIMVQDSKNGKKILYFRLLI